MLINSPNISGSLKVTGNAVITGSLTVLGGINATITGSVTSASYVEYSNVANKPTLVSGSSQVSFNGITDKPTLVSGSTQVSFNGITDKPTLVSGSSQITYSGLSGIPSGIVSGSSQVVALGFATTGSNTFQANQTITGSLFITQNLVVAGSSSIQYISSSVLDIADNIITVNAFNPGVRFGGLAVIDSGSSPQVSGSLLFDSIKDQWIFVHQNQAVVTSSVVLMGPETYNDLGNESYISANRLPKGSGVEHLRDSNISDTGTVVSVNSNTQVTGSFTVVSGSAVELQVTNLGVNIGSALTDNHNVTGSLRVTGSIALTGAGTFSSNITANNNITAAGLIYGRTTNNFPTTGLGYYAIKTNNFDGERGGITLQVSSATNTLTDALTINYLGAATFSSSVTSGGNIFTTNNSVFDTQGSITKHSVIGLALKGVTGSAFDFSIYSADGTALISNTAGTNNINFNTGFVGIGTATPGVKFVNSGATLASVPTLGSGTIGANAILSANGLYGLYTGVASEGWVWQQVQRNDSNSAVYSLVLQPSGGNVGIGTTSITNGTTFGGGGQINRLKVQSTNYTCLEINGSTSGGSVQFTYGTNSPNQVAGLIGYNYASGTVNEFTISNALSGPLIFATSNTERMRIFANGNVAIQDTFVDNGSKLNITSGAKGGIRIVTDTGYQAISIGGSGTFSMDWPGVGSGRFLVRDDGLIAFPRINDFTTGNSPNTWINPASSYGIYINTSSRRYKKDIVTYDKGLDIVNQLRPVYYKGISEVDGDKQFVGLIAEEIHDLGLTEFVNYNEEGLPNSLSYPNMIALAFKAIQEQQSQIETLKSKIEILEQS
jgi:hypothetical protein